MLASIGLLACGFIVLLAITSPFAMLVYQSKRDAAFENLSTQYGLRFDHYPISWYAALYAAAVQTPPTIRSLKGYIGKVNVIVEDYAISIVCFGDLNFLTGYMRTKVCTDGVEKQFPKHALWRLTPVNKIRSFLEALQRSS